VTVTAGHPAQTRAQPALTIIRLAGDPLAMAGDPDLIAMREDLGRRLAHALPGETTRVSPRTAAGRAARLAAAVDLIVQHSDKAAFGDDDEEGRTAFAALTEVTAILALQPGGIDFAGRHWCADRGGCGINPGAEGETITAAQLSAGAKAHLRKETGSYYTPPELVDELLRTTVLPQVLESLTADGSIRAAPLVSQGNGERWMTPRVMPGGAEEALLEITVCDPACGAGVFLIRAARLIAWYLAMYRAAGGRHAEDELPRARREVITRLIHGVDLNPLAVDLTRLVLAAEAYIPGAPNPYLAHHVKCGNALLGTTPALLAKGIPDTAYKGLEGDDPKLAAAARRRNRAEREAWLNGLRPARPAAAPPRDAMARAAAAPTLAQAHRELENAPELRRAKRVADAWCAAFVWPHAPGAPEPVTTGTLLHLDAGGQLAPDAEATLAGLTRQYQFFHWHLEFPGIFRPPGSGETAPAAGTA
jgi:hypothetical protein